MKRSLTALIAALPLAACGSSPAPHSDYFVVTFLPGLPAPSDEGVEALGNAVRAAERAHPRLVVIAGDAMQGEAEPALEKARADAIFTAFTKAGVDATHIRIEMRPVGAQGYAASKDGFIVQLGYGQPPHS